MLDLYLLITQGQYSPNTEFKTYAAGYSIFVEEEIIEVPVRRGGSGAPGDIVYKKKKRIYLKVKLDDGKVFEKDIILNNVNLSVTDVRQVDKDIIIEVNDPSIENSNKAIKVKVNF